MGAYNMKHVLLLLLAIIMAATIEGVKAGIIKTPKVTVQILNGLSKNQELTLHCKSKDDDLGVHTIGNKATYEFSFRPRFLIHTTLFFCSFSWHSDPSLHYFDIYKEDRDWWCDQCSWTISESGPCIYDELIRHAQCYPWNPAP